jgi:PIN domain nuclease of toxin-antitoxin system
MAVELDRERHPVRPTPAAQVILLDTNALIWIDQGNPRAKRLTAGQKRVYISPASVLELQFLLEAGRIRLRAAGVSDVVERGPWLLDDLPAAAWFEEALNVSWTRDPFDRLIAAHALLRGWRLASADAALLENLPDRLRLDI